MSCLFCSFSKFVWYLLLVAFQELQISLSLVDCRLRWAISWQGGALMEKNRALWWEKSWAMVKCLGVRGSNGRFSASSASRWGFHMIHRHIADVFALYPLERTKTTKNTPRDPFCVFITLPVELLNLLRCWGEYLCCAGGFRRLHVRLLRSSYLTLWRSQVLSFFQKEESNVMTCQCDNCRWCMFLFPVLLHVFSKIRRKNDVQRRLAAWPVPSEFDLRSVQAWTMGSRCIRLCGPSEESSELGGKTWKAIFAGAKLRSPQ